MKVLAKLIQKQGSWQPKNWMLFLENLVLRAEGSSETAWATACVVAKQTNKQSKVKMRGSAEIWVFHCLFHE